MDRILAVVLAASALLFADALPATAHHSFAAAFDADQPVSVKGVVTQIRLENPHSWFFLDVKTDDGKIEHWSFEASTPTSLLRSGLSPSFVKVGDEITIKGWHARDASANAGAARELILSDGRAFAIGPMVGPSR